MGERERERKKERKKENKPSPESVGIWSVRVTSETRVQSSDVCTSVSSRSSTSVFRGVWVGGSDRSDVDVADAPWEPSSSASSGEVLRRGTWYRQTRMWRYTHATIAVRMCSSDRITRTVTGYRRVGCVPICVFGRGVNDVEESKVEGMGVGVIQYVL